MAEEGLWPPLGCSFENTDSTLANTQKALQNVRHSDIAEYNFLNFRRYFN